MWLVSDLTPADIDDPLPGTVIAGRIEADHLDPPFRLGALLVMQILRPADPYRLARSTFRTMATTLPLCGFRASRPTSGLSIASRTMAPSTGAPWPGAAGIRERQ